MVNKERTVKVRTRLDLDERREALLSLGRALFGRHSYDELSIDDIAKKAGISKGLLYHYFPTKRIFYIETFRAAADELLRLSEPDPKIHPTRKLIHSLDAYLAYVEANGPAYVSLLTSGVGVDPEIGKIIERCRHKMLERLLDGLGGKKPSPQQLVALYGWIGFVEGATLQWLRSGELTRTELSKLYTRQLGLILASAGLVSKVQLALWARVQRSLSKGSK